MLHVQKTSRMRNDHSPVPYTDRGNICLCVQLTLSGSNVAACRLDRAREPADPAADWQHADLAILWDQPGCCDATWLLPSQQEAPLPA